MNVANIVSKMESKALENNNDEISLNVNKVNKYLCDLNKIHRDSERFSTLCDVEIINENDIKWYRNEMIGMCKKYEIDYEQILIESSTYEKQGIRCEIKCLSEIERRIKLCMGLTRKQIIINEIETYYNTGSRKDDKYDLIYEQNIVDMAEYKLVHDKYVIMKNELIDRYGDKIDVEIDLTNISEDGIFYGLKIKL